jgi:hypothetical protein
MQSPGISARLYTRLTTTTYYLKDEDGTFRHTMARLVDCGLFGDY